MKAISTLSLALILLMENSAMVNGTDTNIKMIMAIANLVLNLKLKNNKR